MNRRGFFGSVVAVITAAVIPIDFRDRLHGVPIWYSDPMSNVWWRAGDKVATKIGAREIAALERAWTACIKGGQHPSQIYITDEQLMELGDEIHRSGRA